MTVALSEGRVSVILSLDEARALRKFIVMAVPRERTPAALEVWHEAAKTPQSMLAPSRSEAETRGVK